jgi:CheY-like chemotaxis protein
MKPLQGVRVLVVEDDDDAREITRAILEQAGAAVVAVDGARPAIEALEKDPPQVVVSDISMPGEDGHTFLRKVRALPRGRGGRIPAVALTASNSRETRLQSREAGFHYHLTKPANPEQLVEIVAALVRLTSR